MLRQTRQTNRDRQRDSSFLLCHPSRNSSSPTPGRGLLSKLAQGLLAQGCYGFRLRSGTGFVQHWCFHRCFLRGFSSQVKSWRRSHPALSHSPGPSPLCQPDSNQQWGMCQLSTRILRIPKPRDSHWVIRHQWHLNPLPISGSQGLLRCEPGHLETMEIGSRNSC